MKFFGSICYVHVPLNLRHKLKCNNHKCIFVGYSTSEKGCRIFGLITKKIILPKDALFDENGGWNWEVNSEKSFNVLTTTDI